MCPVIVNKQDHFALRMSRQLIGSRDGGQQASEPNVVAAAMNHMHRLAGDWVDSAPIPAFRGSHTGCQDDALLSNGRPAAGDGWQQAHFGGVSEQKDKRWANLALQISNPFFSPRPAQDPACA